MQDKEGKKCLFMIKSLQKSFEISASDKKKRQEWIQGESQEKMHEGQENKKNIFVHHCLFFLKKENQTRLTATDVTLCTFSPDWQRGSHVTTDLNLTLSRSWL